MVKQLEANLSKALLKVSRLEKDIREVEDEKQDILIKMVNAEQEVQDIQRDVELKDITIQSL